MKPHKFLPALVTMALLWAAITMAAPIGASYESTDVRSQLAAVQIAPQHDTCSVPITQGIRGKDVILDQCYDRTFSYDGTTYRIHTYYTENDAPANGTQCDPSNPDDYVGRCEHEMSDNDDTNGDNVNAVATAVEVENAMRFYFDRNLDYLGSGITEFNIYIAEDPRGGGLVPPNSIYVDDELIDSNDVLWKRLLAVHEIHHLVQDKYDSGVDWGYYGEGTARAVEDRYDSPLDGDTGHLFIPEIDTVLATDASRTNDLFTLSYQNAAWWTWVLDQYRTGSEAEPLWGWSALRDFYLELRAESGNPAPAVRDFISSKGSTFIADFIDYTLALYAHRFNPGDPRLGFLDNEIRNSTGGLRNHNVITGGPAFATTTQAMNPRSSRYWEYNPASQCDFVAFTFDGNGTDFAFSVMTVDGGNLQQRWTSQADTWARTVRSANLDRVVGVVTALENAGSADIGHGCVTPTISIKSPTTSAFEMVGLPDNPRQFIVRVEVTGTDGSGVAGLTAGDFQVSIRENAAATPIPVTVVNAAYVQDDYWLLVQAPDAATGVVGGAFYDLVVTLAGAATDSQTKAVLYVERTQDVMIVLDRSGSMGGSTGRIEAARNAATLLANELSEDDQGGYVAFDHDPYLRVGMAQVDATQRITLQNTIDAETPGGATSIGDGLQTAAAEEAAKGIADNMCSFILLSDGHENDDEYWADVRDEVVDNGCAIHAVGLGPGANEPLLQQIAAAVPGGSYDYADVSGNIPIAGVAAADVGGLATSVLLAWPNNLGRIYDIKAAQVAGRQRIFSTVGGSRQKEGEDFKFFVDDATDTLLVSLSWQSPSRSHETELLDPDGNSVDPAAARRLSRTLTNEVWEIRGAQKGYWTLRVTNLFQEYYVSATADTRYVMYLFIGTPLADRTQGVQVPIFVTFVGGEKPLLGADVTATVRAPGGSLQTLRLYDDGNHMDSEAADGIYANVYGATTAADLVELNPEKVVEGEEPPHIGSYLVNAIGIRGDLRREAQGSFVIEPGADADGDRLPDLWEAANGLDPRNGQDGGDDPDQDGLPNHCEFQVGTDPQNSDTDGGGESDGSEVGRSCSQPMRDPLNPDDDQARPLTGIQVHPEVYKRIPLIHLTLGRPISGTFISADIFRRTYDAQGQMIANWEPITRGLSVMEFSDFDVVDDQQYQYRVVPRVSLTGPNGRFAGPSQSAPVAAVSESSVVEASVDPYPPTGSIVINDGAMTTTSTTVTLTLAATDSGSHHGEPDNADIPGTPATELQMRLNNSPDFSGVTWQPFQATVSNWELGPVASGDVANVYVQFMDAEGNVGTSGFAQTDSIIYEVEEAPPVELYLPLVQR